MQRVSIPTEFKRCWGSPRHHTLGLGPQILNVCDTTHTKIRLIKMCDLKVDFGSESIYGWNDWTDSTGQPFLLEESCLAPHRDWLLHSNANLKLPSNWNAARLRPQLNPWSFSWNDTQDLLIYITHRNVNIFVWVGEEKRLGLRPIRVTWDHHLPTHCYQCWGCVWHSWLEGEEIPGIGSVFWMSVFGINEVNHQKGNN